MPSTAILEKKKQAVAELSKVLSSSVAGVLVDYRGISVSDDTKLRRELREANIQYSVIKNSILLRATEDAGLGELAEHLVGTTAVAMSPDDHTAAARILNGYIEKSKSKTFKLKAGFLDGKVISLDMVESLAKLPTREVLLATVCNAFQAPIAAFARAMQAVVDKGGEAAPAAETSAEETASVADAPAEAPAETPAEEAPPATETPEPAE
ncbi:MAG: 50S ribosomal protein L10 [Oscillospiraceae bacterium]|nr:50S ribosomal protein L10 [Oscillospiraceae bacterium]